MAQVTAASHADGRGARCAMADCQLKRLTVVRGLMERCGLCDARRPFRSVVKCLTCKTAFHRVCATDEVMGGCRGPVVVRVHGARESSSPASPDTGTTAPAVAAGGGRPARPPRRAKNAARTDATECGGGGRPVRPPRREYKTTAPRTDEQNVVVV